MNKNYIREIAEALSHNHAALMVGAGFSKNAEKISAVSEKSFLNWNELSDMFYETLYEDGKNPGKEYYSSLRLAQEVEIMKGRPKLEKILKDAIPDDQYAPSKLYVELLELPWRDIFTTNYDTLLERAADKVLSRRYNVVLCQEDLVNSNGTARILKLHGSFPSHRPFIITEEDYRTYPVKFAAMVNTVQQSLLENVFCMIGFSCDDPNFLKWIGWIHDNLGKSASEKIYMISVNHISEPKKNLMLEKNIIVIDLEDIWREESPSERIHKFLNILKDDISKKAKKEKWFEASSLSLNFDSTFEEKIKLMKQLNGTYPGAIFLPWKMKNKIEMVLDQIRLLNDYKQHSFEIQIDYIYEYVKLMNIVGRPLLRQDTSLIFEIVTQNNSVDLKIESQIQVIYIHLLRAYRELAEWDNYDRCKSKINKDNLCYNDKQLLYANDCWENIFRNYSENLASLLDNWNLAEGDLYWPLIKAGFYAQVGEMARANEILSKALVAVRKQLVKSSDDDYLSSIEESMVSLINFIKQSCYTSLSDFEACQHDGNLSWWDQNEKYCIQLNSESEKCPEHEEKYNFDLTITYSKRFAQKDSDVIYALEYLRFLEQTGHFFRLNNVTNTKGLHNTIKKLSPYYPYWCFIQLLISQDKEDVDMLFGRVHLSRMTNDEADNMTREFLKVLEKIMGEVRVNSSYLAETIYEQSANVLPEIIARLCFKNSLVVLDEVLDLILKICLSDKNNSFKGINKVLKVLMKCYDVTEQEKRIDKILNFPLYVNHNHEYCDPVLYLMIPEREIKLADDVYSRVLFKIKDTITNGNEKQKKSAINRLEVLSQVIWLEIEDYIYLCQLLKSKDSIENNELLYYVSKEKDNNILDKIYEETMMRISADSTSKSFSSGNLYNSLIRILKNYDVHKIDIDKHFEILEKLVHTNISWVESYTFGARERIKQSLMLGVGVIILCEKNKIDISKNAKIESYFETLKTLYHNSVTIDVIVSSVCGVKNISREDIKNKLLFCGEEELELLYYFYETLRYYDYPIQNNTKLSENSRLIFEILIYALAFKEINEQKSVLIVLNILINNEVIIKDQLKILDNILKKMISQTIVVEDDTEQCALIKCVCRIRSCIIASELYKRNVKTESVLLWKEISNDADEFIEIRNVKFDE